MSGMLIGGRSLLESMGVIGMGGTRRRLGEAMGSVYGSIFNLVGLGFRDMFAILLDPGIQSGFGRIGGAKKGRYEMFSLPYIRLPFINRLWCLSIYLGILKLWFGQ